MIQAILAEYELPQPYSWSCLGNSGGFSGSTIWKIATAECVYCLRRWPPGVETQKIDWIHRVLRFARANGCPQIVVPIVARSGATCLKMGGDHWELCRWSNGQADFGSRPNPQRLDAAMETLAGFHQAAARFHLSFGRSENLRQVIQQLNQFDQSVALVDQHRRDNRCVLANSDWLDYCASGISIARVLSARMQPGAVLELALQPVIRDVRCEHFFFEANRVCGLIDFGAMQIDTVACDLARMLGSMAGRDHQARGSAMDHYANLRPLSSMEREMIDPLMKAGWLVGVLNWMRWLHVEQRHFDSLANVKARIQQLFELLREID